MDVEYMERGRPEAVIHVLQLCLIRATVMSDLGIFDWVVAKGEEQILWWLVHLAQELKLLIELVLGEDHELP